MSIIHQAPSFSSRALARLTEEHFGVTGELQKLPSERDQNYLIRSSKNECFVLKVANSEDQFEALEAQNLTMARINASSPICPVAISTPQGDTIVEITGDDGASHLMRLLTFLPGIPFADASRHSSGLLTDLGTTLGKISCALAGFDHTNLHREFHWDLRHAPKVVATHIDKISDTGTRNCIQHIAEMFAQIVEPRFGDLRKSIIHNDANDYNVIVDSNNGIMTSELEVRGIIDFGDIVSGFTIGDLAVAIAYAMLGKVDPLKAAADVVRAYHRIFPITENEIAVLFPLALMRLSISVCHAAHQQQDRPDDPYLSISQKPIREILPLLTNIPLAQAESVFRHACSLPPVAIGPAISEWLKKHGPTRVMHVELVNKNLLVLDLGIASPIVSGDPSENSTEQMTARIWKKMRASGSAVAIGQYNEARLLYTTPIFEAAHGQPGENRTIHLGLDVFANPDTKVIAPLDGTVHLAGINSNDLDYGGVVILKHDADGDIFYSLYGHLEHDAVRALEIGQSIKKGDAFAALGTPEENGGWAPHLHFQIILDLLDMGLEFPGVCTPTEREIWCAFSPDPNLLLQLPDTRVSPAKTDAAEALSARRRHIAPSLSIGYQRPLKIERGWMQYLFDHTGRRFLDAYNNVPHVGHCHPEVVAAASEQMSILNTNTRYLHDGINRYAERLCSTMPESLDVCFFVNSASEGNELALRLARAATGQKNFIVLEGAYHGHTNALIDISPYKHDGPGGQGAPDWVYSAPIADVYRGRYKADDPEAATKYARHVQNQIDAIHSQNQGLCGFIAESYPSVGGQIILPDGYLKQVYDDVRAAGGICIADEVQTGYGRIGTHFYAFDAQGVVPDIVVLGKPIGNGHPISAVVTTHEIAEAFDTGMEFFSTFGGNTVSCAAGLTVLEITLREGFQEHAQRVGSYLLDHLRSFKGRFPLVGDVRGAGLFLGIELVRDHETLEPAAQEAAFIVDRMREEGILMGTDGPLHNVIKIRPPLPFDEPNADQLVRTMARILEEELRS